MERHEIKEVPRIVPRIPNKEVADKVIFLMEANINILKDIKKLISWRIIFITEKNQGDYILCWKYWIKVV